MAKAVKGKFFGMQITGAEAMALNTKLLEDGIPEEIRKAITQGMSEISTRAQEILTEKNHVVTGNLRRSIVPVAVVEGNEIAGMAGSFPPGMEGFIGSDAPYAPIVERLPDGGYLKPAFDEKKKDVQEWIGKAILIQITKIKAPKPSKE